jgi:hypothetical protein
MKTINRSLKKVPVAGMKQKLLSALVLGIVPISLASPSYAAFDYKIQPGSSCRPVNGSQSGALLILPNYLQNKSNSTIDVTCPLVRDSFLQTKIGMSILVASGGGNLFCQLITTDFVGSESGNTRFIRSSNFPFGSTETTPHFHHFNVEKNDTFFQGPYSIQCVLPPRSKVYYTRSAEDGATDNGN